MDGGDKCGEEPQGRTPRASLRALPLKEILIATALVSPCLAFIFANPFILFVPWGPPPEANGTADPTSDSPLAKTVNSGNRSSDTMISLVADDEEDTEDEDEDDGNHASDGGPMQKTVFTELLPDAEKSLLDRKSQEIKLLFLAFGAIGCICAGILSDVSGRRFTSLLMVSVTIVSGLLASVSTDMFVFEALWCVLAIGCMGSHVSNYVRLTELLPDSIRTPTALFVFGSIWALSRLIALFFAFICRDWMMITFFLSFCVCLVLLGASLRPRHIRTLTVHRGEQVDSSDSDADRIVNGEDKLYHLVTRLNLLVRLVALAFSFFTAGLIFYGFNLSRHSYLFKTIYSNLLFTGLIDFLAEILAAGICHQTRRTLPVFFFFMLCNGVCCFVMTAFDSCRGDFGWLSCSRSSKSVELLTHFTSLFTGGAAFNILWLLSFSSFPTGVRNTALGIASSAGRIGGIVGILLVDAGMIYGSAVSLVLVGGLAILAGLTTLLLVPERGYRGLLQTADQERLEKDADRSRGSEDASASSVTSLDQTVIAT